MTGFGVEGEAAEGELFGLAAKSTGWSAGIAEAPEEAPWEATDAPEASYKRNSRSLTQILGTYTPNYQFGWLKNCKWRHTTSQNYTSRIL